MSPLIEGWKNGAHLLLAGRLVQLLNSFLLSVIVVRRFGLDVMGTFAIGFIAATILTCLVPLGLPSFLPRVKQCHARSCYAAGTLHLAIIAFLLPVVWVYAWIQSNTNDQFAIIFLVSLGGTLIGASNTGLMLSIMKRSFHPGLVAPLCEMTGLLIGALFARTAVTLAAFYFSGRLAGAMAIWLGLRFRRIAFKRLSLIAQRSFRFMVPDILALLSEQSAPLLLTVLIPRSELAIFRICQQILNAADTPGWTFVQSKYPQLVTGTRTFVADTRTQIGRLGWLAAVGCGAGSAILGYFVYHVPAISHMMALLSATLFWRYSNNFFDQALRATGRVNASMWLAGAKATVSFVIFVPLVLMFHLWGAISALALLSVISGIAYEMVFRDATVPALVRLEMSE